MASDNPYAAMGQSNPSTGQNYSNDTYSASDYGTAPISSGGSGVFGSSFPQGGAASLLSLLFGGIGSNQAHQNQANLANQLQGLQSNAASMYGNLGSTANQSNANYQGIIAGQAPNALVGQFRQQAGLDGNINAAGLNPNQQVTLNGQTAGIQQGAQNQIANYDSLLSSHGITDPRAMALFHSMVGSNAGQAVEQAQAQAGTQATEQRLQALSQLFNLANSERANGQQALQGAGQGFSGLAAQSQQALQSAQQGSQQADQGLGGALGGILQLFGL